MLSFQKYSKRYIQNESILVEAVNKLEYTDVKDQYGYGYYHYLAWSGNYDILIKLIEENMFDISVKNDYNSTIWHYLALSGNYDSLLKAISDPLIKNNGGYTIFQCIPDVKLFIEEVNKITDLHPQKNKIIQIIPSKYKYLLKNELEIKWNLLSEDIQEKIIEENPDLICPISKDFILDPVINSIGHLYSRKNIEQWYLTHDTDPRTNIEVENKVLCPVFIFEQKIKEILNNTDAYT